nr:Arl16 [Gefionella okellyi]
MAADVPSMDAALFGVESVGKTLLVKQLKFRCKNPGETPPVIDTPATMGVELDEFTYQKTNFKVREVGGTFIPVWPKYFKECASVIYLIDMSHTTQISAACMEFYQLLRAPDLQGKPFLLLLNKIDLPSRMTRSQLDELIRLNDLQAQLSGRLTVEEISAFSLTNIDAVLQWMLRVKKQR